MIVEQIMCRFPVIVDAERTTSDALALAIARQTHFMLAVCDQQLLGVLRVCDLKRCTPNTSAGRNARLPIMTIAASDTVAFAERMLTLGGTGCLIVVDPDCRVEGTVSRKDLLRAGIGLGERGVDCCAACGAVCHLIFTDTESPALCCECHEAATQLRTAADHEITVVGSH